MSIKHQLRGKTNQSNVNLKEKHVNHCHFLTNQIEAFTRTKQYKLRCDLEQTHRLTETQKRSKKTEEPRGPLKSSNDVKP